MKLHVLVAGFAMLASQGCANVGPSTGATSTILATNPDDFAKLPDDQPVVRWCLEKKFTVLQIKADIWQTNKDVILHRIPHAGHCPAASIFANNDTLRVEQENGRYFLSVLRPPGSALLKKAKLTQEPGQDEPTYWHVTSENTKYYLFLVDMKNSTSERVKYYLIMAFAPSCGTELPADALIKLKEGETCGEQSRRQTVGLETLQTDVGGGGENK
jgi:hypothetical protein